MAAEETPRTLSDRIATARKNAGLASDATETLDDRMPKAPNGLELVVAVCAFGFLGFGADRWLDTKPWLMLLGLLIGLVVGLWNLHRASLGADALSVGLVKKDR
mgnify:CR=1 FL=1